jgi:hypothetical protein
MPASPRRRSLSDRFPPSAACTCEVCVAYCARPGWWSVEQAAAALDAVGARMMLELSPDRRFAALAPAFRGCEGRVATSAGALAGCTFLVRQRCELFETPHAPLECRFCHHERRHQGRACHDALVDDWRRPAGQAVVGRWQNMMRMLGRT